MATLPDALAVEMEGAALAQVAHDFGRPCAVLRTVSDRADDSAHVDFPRFLREVAAEYSRDIVLGTRTVNIGAFKTGTREKGRGSDFSEWNPMDLLRSDGSAGQDPNAWVARTFAGDPALIDAAKRVRSAYPSGKVVEGVIGSSDMWNSELDRIAWLHDKFGTSVEEMEAAAAAQVASLSQVPFLGIRVLSNNITNGAPYVRETAVECQQYVLQVVQAYVQQVHGGPPH